jgi:AcrR family transcriptional regulator
MSSSAVYRYFGSKDEIIRASAEIGVERVGDIFAALLDRDPCPTPAETLALLVDELHTRTDNPEYDITAWPCRPGPRRCAIRSYTGMPAPDTATRWTTSSS